MSLLVSVSGAQSTGKTTLLEGVNSTLRFPVDEFKVARAVLEEFGEGLYDILKSEAKTTQRLKKLKKQPAN
jgi:uridine kinase